MQRLLAGLSDFSTKKVIRLRPAQLEVVHKGEHKDLETLKNYRMRVKVFCG